MFAIAITLLVLEIGVPEDDFDDLLRGILDQWPSYLAYVTSFFTIGGIWLAHHAIFRRLDQADGTVTRLNLLLLMFVSFLPFPTALVAEAFTRSDSERVAAIFYGTALLAISVVRALMWRHISRHRDLLAADVSDAEVDQITRESTPSLGFYAAIVGVALVAPRVAAVGYLVMALLLIFRSRGDSARVAASRPVRRRED